MRRLCLECLCDYTSDPEIPLCPSCGFEHMLRSEFTPIGGYPRPGGDGDFYGMTIDDVDVNDLKDGYYVASISGDYAYDPPDGTDCE